MTNRIRNLALLSTATTALAALALPTAASAQSTTCTLRTGTTNVYDCLNGTTGVSTVTVAGGTFTGTSPLTVTSATGNIDLTAAPVAGGTIQNVANVAGTDALRLANSFAGGAITLTAPGQNFLVTGEATDAIEYTATGGAVNITAGNLTATSPLSFGLFGNGGSTTNITVGNISSGSSGADISGTGNITYTGGTINSGQGFGLSIGSETGVTSVTTGAITALRGALLSGTSVIFNGNGVTASNGFGIQATGTTGPVTIRSGAVSSVAGEGIIAAATTGAIDIGSCPTVTTLDVNSPGIVATTTTGNITVNCGAVSTSNQFSDGVNLSSTSGNINLTTTSVSATPGLDSDGVVIATGGTITTSTGPITTAGNDSVGLLITGGAGAVQAGYGNISTTGTGASYPVLISTTSGAINLAGGNVSATGANQIGIELTSASGAITGTTGSITANGAGSRGLVVNGAGGGLVTLTTGAISTANDGVVITNGADPITLTTGAVTTTEADAPAVTLASTGAITVTTGQLTTGGGTAARANSPALLINGGAGAVTATVAGATTTGAGSDAISITSTGPVTVTNSGTIAVSGPGSVGIDIATTGTGAVNVTTGVVNSTATNPATEASFGAVRVVAGGAAPVAVTANGNITAANGSGIWAQTAGGATVTVNSGVTVSGPTAVTLGGTTGNTLVVNGTLNSTTAGRGGYVLAGTGPLSLSIGANGVLGGPLTFTAGNDSFTNAATYTQSSTIDFLAGNDTFTNSGTFNHGGIVQFGAGTDTLTNSGTLNLSSAAAFDFGADADVFNNSGTLNLRNGAQTLAGLETFNNSGGIIDLRDGAANDVLTISGNYAATGNARLAVDVGGGTADRLVYTGTTTGTTTILPTFTDGNVIVNPTGVLVVDAGTVAAGQFVLDGTPSTGLINYGLETRGSDVFLTATPDEAVGDLVLVNRLGNEIWYQSAEAYQSYAMSRRVDFGNERKSPVGVWAQLYGSKDRFGDRNRSITAFGTALTSSSRFETKRRGAQAGLEFGAPNFLIGVTGGYEHADGGTDFGTNLDVEGYNYGVYAQFGAKQGLYAGVLLKRDDYDVRILNSGIGANSVVPDGRSTGIDGEVGFRFGGPGGANIDVGAGLSYVRSRIDDFDFGNLTFDNDRYTSTRGRLQARASFAGAVAPFVDGKIFREFNDGPDQTVRSGTLSTDLVDQKRGTWGRVEAGIGGGAGGGPLLSAWVDVGDVRGWGIRGGFRF